MPSRDKKETFLQIVAKTDCPLDFECTKPGANHEDIHYNETAKLVECRKSKVNGCRYGVHFGDVTYCKCPVMLFMARQSHKRD